MQENKKPNVSDSGHHESWRMPVMIWNVIYPIFIYFAVCEICNILFRMLPVGWGQDAIVRQAVNTAAALVVIFEMFIRKDKTLQLWKSRETNTGCKGAALLAVIAVTLTSISVNNLLTATPIRQTSESYKHVAQVYYSAGFFWQLLALVILAPVAEEMLYRVIVQTRLKDMMGAVGAVFFSSLLFAVLHRNIVQGIYAMLVGLMLGLVMEAYGDVRIVIAGHMAANFLAIVRGRIAIFDRIVILKDICNAISRKGSIGYWIYSVIFLVIAIGYAYCLYSRIRQRNAAEHER